MLITEILKGYQSNYAPENAGNDECSQAVRTALADMLAIAERISEQRAVAAISSLVRNLSGQASESARAVVYVLSDVLWVLGVAK